ncbi:hypothetical protein PHLGIDRAFT_191071 [Phlebiopsis gigantea 11061_1 CR5-6]|uniref:Uncharacterized protein n=1 Tax=Phlebiopsis gigantea (strain 11061_1 CR5-6) TaxID=745531 RepID=A0A0C3PFU4_PHLG1|nr:hypothetical protein PHLGIDRAFT_191071 [Phlebiopsis gigantea 11061_1 CR5-6]
MIYVPSRTPFAYLRPQTAILPSSFSSAARARVTASERLRERKLRDDPLATVQSPQLVVCNRCGASIKLSLKSAFDPFHWSRHRERCLKRPDAVVQSMRDANDKVPLPWPSTYKAPPKRHVPRRVSTPPLVPDSEEDQRSSTSGGCVEDPPSPPSQPAALSPEPSLQALRSPLFGKCDLGLQAFQRWHDFSTRSFDAQPEDYAAFQPVGEHYDPMYWPRITYQESLMRSTR